MHRDPKDRGSPSLPIALPNVLRRKSRLNLKPETARIIAKTLHLFAEGPPQFHNFSHRVEDRTAEPHSALFYANTATLVLGAWDAYAPQHPGRHIVVRWDGWTMRSNGWDRA
jgi:hypothetical protein